MYTHTTSQGDAVRHLTDGKMLQVIVAGEVVQGGLDQVLQAREVGNLVCRHRVTPFKGIQLLLN